MQWKKYPEEKPDINVTCYVTNKKRGYYAWLGFYNQSYDYFASTDPRYEGFPIEVTHFIELPELPKD